MPIRIFPHIFATVIITFCGIAATPFAEGASKIKLESPKWVARDLPAVEWHLIAPRYPIDDTIVAGCTVQEFGAKGDGATDDTAAFQAALNKMAAAGGGTVFAPEGRYALRRSLTIPPAVTLRGEWEEPTADQPLRGTILQAYAGRGEASGKPFITINFCAGIKDLAIWYPEQKADRITPYPFTILQDGKDNMTVENVTLVNAYQGVKIGPESNELHYLHNLYGSPLKTGIEFDMTTDIGRLENVNFSPLYWSASELPGAPAADGPHAVWMLENGTGIRMYRSDWEYGAFVYVSGYATGFEILGSKRGYPNAQFYGFEITECRKALVVKGCNAIGVAFTRCTFEGIEVGVEALETFSDVLQFQGCRIGAGTDGPSVVNRGTGYLSLITCNLEGAVRAESGSLAIMNCDFPVKRRPDIELAEGVVAATILGNRSAGGLAQVVNHCNEGEVVINHKPISLEPLPVVKRPVLPKVVQKSGRLLIVTDPEWGAKRDATTDDTPAIQKALDAAEKGDIVFLPGGDYRIDGALVVPSGIEMRGVYEIPHHSMGCGSVLHVFGGQGKANGPACVTLRDNSTLRGITFHYPNQSFSNPLPYPFAVRGQGSDIRIVNITAANVYQYVDLMTQRCDRHWLDYVSGAPMSIGIQIGGGSRGGVVRNTQFNPHYWARTDYPDRPVDKAWRILWNYQKENLDAFILGDCENEVQFQNFVFGSLYGIHLVAENGRGPNGIVHGHGTDGSKVGARFDGLGEKGMNFVNAELVAMATTDKTYIELGKGLEGQVALFNTLLWAPPDHAAIIKGGRLVMQQANFLDHGNGFHVDGGDLALTGCFFWRPGLKLRLDAPTQPVGMLGNITHSGFEVLGKKERVAAAGNVQRRASLPPDASEISVALTKAPRGLGIEFPSQAGDTSSEFVEINGIPGWRVLQARPDNTVRFLYFDVTHPKFREGRTPKVEIELFYFDQGRFEVGIAYDSSDESVQVDHSPGAWKRPGLFHTSDTGRWCSARFRIEDALFQGRCNGHDIRIEVYGPHALVVGKMTIRKIGK